MTPYPKKYRGVGDVPTGRHTRHPQAQIGAFGVCSLSGSNGLMIAAYAVVRDLYLSRPRLPTRAGFSRLRSSIPFGSLVLASDNFKLSAR